MVSRIALVTGAYGMIGRYVSRQLQRDGWQVHGIGRGNWSAEQYSEWGLSTWTSGDISLDVLCTLPWAPELIVHCAGSGSVAASMANPYADFNSTVGTTVTVLEYMRKLGPEAVLVYPSSAAVYGISDELPTPEWATLQPASPYGVHKLAAEEMVRSYGRFFGVKASIVRLFSIYGEEFRKQLLWDACQKISVGNMEFFGTGAETRDWLHAKDAANLLVKAGEHATSGEVPVVNGAAGVKVTVRSVLQRLAELMGKDPALQFCGTQRPGDPVDYHADMSVATGWGWAPRVDLQEGLAAYVAWFESQERRTDSSGA